MARPQLVDLDVTRYYHCISRCVRRAFLCGEGFEHRRQSIEDRIEVLAENFAVSVCGFSVMDNHLHVLVRLDPGIADAWSTCCLMSARKRSSETQFVCLADSEADIYEWFAEAAEEPHEVDWIVWACQDRALNQEMPVLSYHSRCTRRGGLT